jgi:hypothetical protein
MYFLRARYMNPGTGRFHTQDSYEGANGEPLSLHKYLYANGNPVMGTDPSGNVTLQEVSATLGAIVGYTYRFALVINKVAIFTAEVAGVPTIGIGAGAYVAKESGLAKLAFSFDDILAAVSRLAKGRYIGQHRDLSRSLSALTGQGISQSNHLNQSAAFREGIAHMDGIAVGLKGSIASGEHHLFHASLNTFWRGMKSLGRTSVSNAEYEEALKNALVNTGGFSSGEISGLLHIARKAREQAGYFDIGGLLPKIPDKIDWP